MLGNGPHVLGNGPHMYLVMGLISFVHSIHEYRFILFIGRLGWVVGLSWPLLG